MRIVTNLKVPAALLAASLVIAACSEKASPLAEEVEAVSVPGAPPEGAEELVARGAQASDERQSDELVEFAYAYPVEAARIAKLAAWLDNDRETKREALIAAARRDRTAAEKGGFPYRQHSHLQKWERVTDTPRFLSLSSEIATYTGGAHGMLSFDSLIWDRTRARLLRPMDLFTSSGAFDRAAKDDLCARLNKAKERKGIEWDRSADGPFGECPVPSAQTVWIGSSDGKHLDRLTIAIAPYEVGPWAEGSYRVNLPMSRTIVDAVKPEFAREFLPLN
jgi:hypothetical protein